MFAFSCFVFACRNLVVSFSLSKFVRFIVNYLLSYSSYFYQSKNVTSILVVIVLENGV